MSEVPDQSAARMAIIIAVAGSVAVLWDTHKGQQAIQEIQLATAAVEAMDAMEEEEANPLNSLERREEVKLVKGVKFPISRMNLPRCDTRMDIV